MKFALLFALFFVGISSIVGAGPQITNFGDTTNTRPVHTETIVVESSIWQVKERTVSFRTAPNVFIRGVRHVDYKSHPVTVKIESGGLHSNFVQLKLQSQRGHGINSTVVYYV